MGWRCLRRLAGIGVPVESHQRGGSGDERLGGAVAALSGMVRRLGAEVAELKQICVAIYRTTHGISTTTQALAAVRARGESEDGLVKIGEVARLLNVHPKTIARWVRDNGFPSARIMGARRFDLVAVQEWVLARSHE